MLADHQRVRCGIGVHVALDHVAVNVLLTSLPQGRPRPDVRPPHVDGNDREPRRSTGFLRGGSGPLHHRVVYRLARTIQESILVRPEELKKVFPLRVGLPNGGGDIGAVLLKLPEPHGGAHHEYPAVPQVPSDSQYSLAVDRSGFSTNEWMANAAPSTDGRASPFSMYPYPVSGPVGGTPNVTTSPSDASANPTRNASKNR